MNNKRLNLGCGVKVLEGYENYDKYPRVKGVGFVDLEVLPYPLKYGSYSKVLLDNVLEHIGDQHAVVEECLHLLKSGGVLVIRCPSHHVGLPHKHWYYTPEYFKCLYQNQIKGSSEFHTASFDLISLVRKRKTIKRMLFDIKKRFLNWLSSFIFYEYEWRLLKK